MKHRAKRRGHVGHCRGTQHSPDASLLFLINITAGTEHPHRPAAGIKLNGQGDQGKGDHQAEQNNADRDQGPKGHHQAQDDDGKAQVGADIDHRHQKAAQRQRTIALLLLHGVPSLVRRDAYSRDAGGVIHALRQAERLIARIIMVGQFARHRPHADSLVAVLAQDLIGHPGRGQALAGLYLFIFFIGGAHHPLRDQGQGQRSQH